MKQVDIQAVVDIAYAFDQKMNQVVSTAKRIKDAWSPIEAKLMSRQKAKLSTIRNHKAKACYVRDYLTNNPDLKEQCNQFLKVYDRIMQKAA